MPNSAPSSTFPEFGPGASVGAAGASSCAAGTSAGVASRLGSGSSGGGVSLEEPPQLEHSTSVSIQVEERTLVGYHGCATRTRGGIALALARPAPVDRNALIGRLVGTVVAQADSAWTVDVAGVGYEVQVPRGTSVRAGSNPAESARITLYVHTHVREDTLDLFGFATELERSVFRLLIGVPNVGPKTALGILSALPPPDLASAVADQDLGRLTSVSGIGKKTAERLILELREKLPRVAELRAPASTERRGDDAGRLLGALTNMGFRPPEAERAVAALGDRIGKEPLSDLLKAALAKLR
jgi:Holliday junction DNA helicase RuvA